MKNIFRALTVILFFSINGCKNERKYIYPQKDKIETQRVCRFIKASGTNRFMVLLGKIYPLNNDGVTVPLRNVTTSLFDGGYFCGRQRFIYDHCFIRENKNLSRESCLF